MACDHMPMLHVTARSSFPHDAVHIRPQTPSNHKLFALFALLQPGHTGTLALCGLSSSRLPCSTCSPQVSAIHGCAPVADGRPSATALRNNLTALYGRGGSGRTPDLLGCTPKWCYDWLWCLPQASRETSSGQAVTVAHAAGVADAACQKGKKGCLQCKNNK